MRSSRVIGCAPRIHLYALDMYPRCTPKGRARAAPPCFACGHSLSEVLVKSRASMSNRCATLIHVQIQTAVVAAIAGSLRDAGQERVGGASPGRDTRLHRSSARGCGPDVIKRRSARKSIEPRLRPGRLGVTAMYPATRTGRSSHSRSGVGQAQGGNPPAPQLPGLHTSSSTASAPVGRSVRAVAVGGNAPPQYTGSSKPKRMVPACSTQ